MAGRLLLKFGWLKTVWLIATDGLSLGITDFFGFDFVLLLDFSAGRCVKDLDAAAVAGRVGRPDSLRNGYTVLSLADLASVFA